MSENGTGCDGSDRFRAGPLKREGAASWEPETWIGRYGAGAEAGLV